MAAERTTQGKRIETLEKQTNNIEGRLSLHDFQLKEISQAVQSHSDSAAGHSHKITVVEQQLHVLDIKSSMAEITAMRLEIVAIKKDIERLNAWTADSKTKTDESARRLWAFGPSIMAAIISAVVSLGMMLLGYWLNKPRA